MSVELLRDAAHEIRVDVSTTDRYTDDQAPFALAVATWLTEVYCALTGAWVDGQTTAGPVGQSEKSSAIAIARAYLSSA